MQINLESVHVTIDRSLKKKISNELSHLAMLFDRIISCDVVLRQGKANIPDNCEVAAQVRLPHHLFFARERANNFEQAIVQAVDNLVSQLKRDKDQKWQLL